MSWSSLTRSRTTVESAAEKPPLELVTWGFAAGWRFVMEFAGLVLPTSELGHLLTDERASSSRGSCTVSVSRADSGVAQCLSIERYRKDGNGSEKRTMLKDYRSAGP